MDRQEVIRRAGKELREAEQNLLNGRKNKASKSQINDLERKVEYRKAVYSYVSYSGTTT